MDTLRLGFVGAGFVANFHAIALKSVRGVEIAGVYALTGAEELSAFSKENGLGDCVVYPSVAELCNNCDAVSIVAPNFARIEIIEGIAEAVKAGAQLKGLICEKPLGRTIAEAKRLVAVAKEVNLPTAYFENQIYMKAITNALSQLAPVQKVMGPLPAAPGTVRSITCQVKKAASTSASHEYRHSGWGLDPRSPPLFP